MADPKCWTNAAATKQAAARHDLIAPIAPTAPIAATAKANPKASRRANQRGNLKANRKESLKANQKGSQRVNRKESRKANQWVTQTARPPSDPDHRRKPWDFPIKKNGAALGRPFQSLVPTGHRLLQHRREESIGRCRYCCRHSPI